MANQDFRGPERIKDTEGNPMWVVELLSSETGETIGSVLFMDWEDESLAKREAKEFTKFAAASAEVTTHSIRRIKADLKSGR